MVRHEVRVVVSATCQGAKNVAAAHNVQNHGGIQLRLLHADATHFRLLVAFFSSQLVTQLHACRINDDIRLGLLEADITPQRLVGGHSVPSLCMPRQHEAKGSSGGVLCSACLVQCAQNLPRISAAQFIFSMLCHDAQLPWLCGIRICR